MNRMELSASLSNVLLPIGFWRKGSAFFRAQGDGVLVIVQFRKERNASYPGHPHFALGLGLTSLYRDLLPQHFSSWGCVTQYDIVQIVGERSTTKLVESGRYVDGMAVLETLEFTPDDQLSVLKEKGVEFINRITDQEQLLHAIYDLDLVEFSGKIYELDMQKYAPLLHVGRNIEAAAIIHKLLSLHGVPNDEHNNLSAIIKCARNEFEKNEAVVLHRKLILAEEGNRNDIEAYLKENYDQNIRWCKKISKV